MTEPKKRGGGAAQGSLRRAEAKPERLAQDLRGHFLNLRIAKYDGVRIDKEVEIRRVNPPESRLHHPYQRWKGWILRRASSGYSER